MLRILKISALVMALLIFGAFHVGVIAQPVVDIIPQLPWEYDPGTGTQVGHWEMELVLTDSAAPIVAYGVRFRGLYEGDDDVPYYGFVADVVTPFLEWDITGTPAETVFLDHWSSVDEIALRSCTAFVRASSPERPGDSRNFFEASEYKPCMFSSSSSVR